MEACAHHADAAMLPPILTINSHSSEASKN
jgi:hypothetical protein